jgi:hypothetical protein
MMMMKVLLARAVERGVITADQATAISAISREAHRELPPCGRAEALSLAAAILLAAVPLAAWLALGGIGLTVAGTGYAALLLAAARRLRGGPWARAGGVLAAAAAVAIPFAVKGVLGAAGWFPSTATAPADIGELLLDPGVWVDASAILAFAFTARRYHYPPFAALLAAACWMLAMDVAPLFFLRAVAWSQRAIISGVMGAIAIVLGFALQRGGRREFVSWLQAVGLVALSVGFTTLPSESPAALALRIPIWAALVALAPLTGRPIFAVFGALSMASDLGELGALRLGRPALVAAAAAIALATATGAAAYAVVERRLDRLLHRALPETLLAFVSPEAARED